MKNSPRTGVPVTATPVAQQFEQKHPGCEILFVGAERGMEQRLVKQIYSALGAAICRDTLSTIPISPSWMARAVPP